MPGDLSEISMRHHNFAETDAKYYDGIVREQLYDLPFTRTTKSEVKPAPTKPTIKVPSSSGAFNGFCNIHWFFDDKTF